MLYCIRSFLRRSYEHSKVEFRHDTKNYTGKLISETVEIDKRESD